ncbi:MAG: right-handed parallel beta-helix repeat-containing protein [Candidatus Lokiarchaeota archaeon]|nr:right-handed parallel beta-helix repeat-containing protein [Candidatus Lokiarchaeota archaeon]
MNLIFKEKASILAILGIIFLSLGLFCINLDFLSKDRTIYSIDRDNNNSKIPYLKTAKISSIIHINNNWTEAKNAGICNGSGTWNDPYVIKDLIIDGLNSSNCIKIQNSSTYFRIENCTLFNAGTDWLSEYAGILLHHTNNGMIIENNCSNNMYGISLVSYSSNNTVFRNYANNNFYTGISLNSLCSNNTVLDNEADNNSAFGISISWNSHNNTISRNNATKNKIGLDISSFSKYNIIKDNNLSFNLFPGGDSNGIRISRAENNSIIRNFVNQNGWEGIQVYESNYNLFLNNSINNNGEHGISLVHCGDNRLIGNNISSNGQYGINLEDCESNIVNHNTINNHDVGIYLDDQSKCNVALNNSFAGNGADILDFQRKCDENDFTAPPIDVLIISIVIVGVMIFITGTILVLRRLSKIKVIRNKKSS